MLQTKNILKKGPHGFIKFGNLYTKYRGGVSKFGNPVTEFVYPERAAIVYGVEFLRPLVETEYLYFQE